MSAASSAPASAAAGAGRLHGALGLAARGPRLVGGALGGVERRAAVGHRRSRSSAARARAAASVGLEPGQLAPAALLGVRVERAELALERAHPLARGERVPGRPRGVVALLGQARQLARRAARRRCSAASAASASSSASWLRAPLAPLLGRGRLVAHPLEPHLDPLGRGAGVEAARLELLALAALRGERLLGRLAPRGHLGQQPLGLVALGAGGHGARLGRGERGAGGARGVGGQRHAAPRATGARSARAARPPRPGA